MLNQLYRVFLSIIRSKVVRLILLRLFRILMNGLASESVKKIVKWIFSLFDNE